MLTYFPAPYPDEWWYSVLCRYHVRSGSQDTAATLFNLYKNRPFIHARLYPGTDSSMILRQMPPDILTSEELLLKHTLLPYYLRFKRPEYKQKIFSRLSSGLSCCTIFFHSETPDGRQGLKFCPLCYAEDKDTFGEPYWHREHQIPLMPLCPKHKYRLQFIEIPFSDLEKIFLPLYGIPNAADAVQADSCRTWEPVLSNVLQSVLAMPLETSPYPGYHNVINVLESERFGFLLKKDGHLNMDAFRRYCIQFYGEPIGRQYFGSIKALRRDASVPERCALLTVLAGMTAEDLFDPEVQTFNPLKTLHSSKKSKKNLIRVSLTLNEKQYIAEAAEKYAKDSITRFAKEILMREVDCILREKGRIW